MGQVSAPVAAVKVGFFGWTGDVVYNGAAPGAVAGVVQINVRVPDQMGPFAYPVDLNLFTAWPYVVFSRYRLRTVDLPLHNRCHAQETVALKP